ncbi:MAG: hypothetical protein Q9217_000072 [Psora testacea]
MMVAGKRISASRAVLIPRHTIRHTLPTLQRWAHPAPNPQGSYASFAERRLPMVMRPSFWIGMIPKFMRPGRDRAQKTPAQIERSKQWNPATFYIWIFLLIGSHGIRMAALRNYYTQFSRKAEIKIALLKEVIEKIQRGEEVDVETALGTGDEVQEQEWKDVLRHIEEEDRLWQKKARRRGRREAQQAEQNAEQNTEQDTEQEAVAKESQDSPSAIAEVREVVKAKLHPTNKPKGGVGLKDASEVTKDTHAIAVRSRNRRIIPTRSLQDGKYRPAIVQMNSFALRYIGF